MRKNEQIRSFMTGVISEWKQSNLKLDAYCELHKINIQKFRYWDTKLKKKKTNGFSKLVLIDDSSEKQHGLRLANFKIEYPTGVNLLVQQEVTSNDLHTLIRL